MELKETEDVITAKFQPNQQGDRPSDATVAAYGLATWCTCARFRQLSGLAFAWRP